MGRITIFTVDDCVHCKRIQRALEEQELPYTEISVSLYPHRRKDMLSLSDCLTVPQIFFHDICIGGADEAFAILGRWCTNSTMSILEHYQKDVASLPDPTDARLSAPTEAPYEKPPRLRPQTDRIIRPTSAPGTVSVRSIMEKLKRILPCGSHNSKSRVFKNSFTGAEAVLKLRKEYMIDAKEAERFGEYLRKRQIFHSVGKDDKKEVVGGDKAIYRLQCYQTPDVLNSYRVWDTDVYSDYVGTLQRLKRLLDKVEKEEADKQTGKVDYARVKENKHFAVFEEAVCELQKVNLLKMDVNGRIAFGINAYNLFIKYAFYKLGVTGTARSRSAFFNGVKFTVAQRPAKKSRKLSVCLSMEGFKMKSQLDNAELLPLATLQAFLQ